MKCEKCDDWIGENYNIRDGAFYHPSCDPGPLPKRDVEVIEDIPEQVSFASVK